LFLIKKDELDKFMRILFISLMLIELNINLVSMLLARNGFKKLEFALHFQKKPKILFC